MFVEGSCMSSYKVSISHVALQMPRTPSGRKMEAKASGQQRKIEKGAHTNQRVRGLPLPSPRDPKEKPGRLRGHLDLTCELVTPHSLPNSFQGNRWNPLSPESSDSNPPWHHKESKISICK